MITEHTKKKYSDIIQFPTTAKISWLHNHVIHAAVVLSNRAVPESTAAMFDNMFRELLSPTEAYADHRADVEMRHSAGEFGDRTIETVLADSSVCPTIGQVRYLHKKYEEAHFGARNGPAMWEHVERMVADYNEKHADAGGKILFAFPNDHGSQFRLAVTTPVMTRTRQAFPQEREMSFVDSTGSVDQQSLTVTVLLIGTCIGALPTGLTISGEKSEQAYTHLFEMLRDLTEEVDPSSRWNPSIAMTDGDSAIRKGLKSTFPDIVLLLCLFHILQAVWRFLFSKESGVDKRHRQLIYKLFRKSAYAPNRDLFDSSRSELYSAEGLTSRSKTYFDGVWKMASDWALHYRQRLVTRGHQTNNMSEVSVRLFKEGVMMRLKARSLGQLLDMCTNQLDAFYRKRLLDLAHSRGNLSHLYRKSSAAYTQGKTIPKDHFQQVAEFSFTVRSQTDPNVVYEMNLLDQLCGCKSGEIGSICKHLYSASMHFNVDLMSLPPQTARTRQRVAWIACGKCEPVEFYADLNASSTGAARALVPSSCQDAPIHETSPPLTSDTEAELARATRAEAAKTHLRRAVTMIEETIDNAGDVSNSLVAACRNFELAIAKANTQTAIESILVGRALKQKSKRKRMSVQTTAPSRRKTGNRSTLPQKRGTKCSDLEISVPTRRPKRQHNLNKSVRLNQANAHKH